MLLINAVPLNLLVLYFILFACLKEVLGGSFPHFF
jgi:hypothetical protein